GGAPRWRRARDVSGAGMTTSARGSGGLSCRAIIPRLRPGGAMRSWAAIGAMAVAMVLGDAGGARAEMTAQQVLAGIDAATAESKGIAIALLLTANGLTWANSDLVARKVTPIFCPPVDEPFAPGQLAELLREAVKRDPKLADRPFGLSL